jgi:hypothetical protein
VRGLLVRVMCLFLWRSFHEVLRRSQRGPAEQRARRIIAGGCLGAMILVLVGLIPYVLWILTGRGPYRWLGANRHVVVPGRWGPLPFPEDAEAALRSGWAFPFTSDPD